MLIELFSKDGKSSTGYLTLHNYFINSFKKCQMKTFVVPAKDIGFPVLIRISKYSELIVMLCTSILHCEHLTKMHKLVQQRTAISSARVLKVGSKLENIAFISTIFAESYSYSSSLSIFLDGFNKLKPSSLTILATKDFLRLPI